MSKEKVLLNFFILKKDKNTLETSFIWYNILTYIYIFFSISMYMGIRIVDKKFKLWWDDSEYHFDYDVIVDQIRLLLKSNVGLKSSEDILEEMNINDIEQFLRKKKLEELKKTQIWVFFFGNSKIILIFVST